MKLSEIAENICRPLELSTGHPVVIAGGAVRDRLWGRKPQDYDIFILEGKLGPPMHNLTVKKARLWVAATSGVGGYTDQWLGGIATVVLGPVATFKYHGWRVQIMVRAVKTVEELLHTFDFNICQFAYRYGEVTKPHSPSWIKIGSDSKYHGKILLNRDAVKENFSLAIRRGLRFSERYNLTFTNSDSEWLCQQMTATSQTKVEGSSSTQMGDYIKYLLGKLPQSPEPTKFDVEGTPVAATVATGAVKPSVPMNINYKPLSTWYDELLWSAMLPKPGSVK